ncbi:hypothetical protein THAOC_19265 [Thalassiosira oceanica]|uniref:Uncharacterized protein n=1 Tax=Thalassiosira oceanica TaxID=159749 RepID=K0SHA4_THAOC|nr:hypothetical protein THAOC_19265 [Thalassiosira oceanica]|eukprot:EJK60391.1 hypothetical protein THAOC_19265 [Thalassiosira oceanica]
MDGPGLSHSASDSCSPGDGMMVLMSRAYHSLLRTPAHQAGVDGPGLSLSASDSSSPGYGAHVARVARTPDLRLHVLWCHGPQRCMVPARRRWCLVCLGTIPFEEGADRAPRPEITPTTLRLLAKSGHAGVAVSPLWLILS